MDVVRDTIALVCGSGVDPAYIREVLFKVGQSCGSRRLSNRLGRRAAATEVRAEYVMVIPATRATDRLGGAEAIANKAMLALQTTPLGNVTEVLTAVIQGRGDTFSGLQVSVSSIGSVTLQVGVNPLVILGQDSAGTGDDAGTESTGGSVFSTLAIVFIVLTSFFCVGAMLWRYRELMLKEDKQQTDQRTSFSPCLNVDNFLASEETSPADKDLAAEDGVPDAANDNPESQWSELDNFNNADLKTEPATNPFDFKVDYSQCPVVTGACCI